MFRYRVGSAKTLRGVICEERIICVVARNPVSAYNKILTIARRSELHYLNDQNQRVDLQFVGIFDALRLVSDNEEEVWYDIWTHPKPARRRLRVLKKSEAINRMR